MQNLESKYNHFIKAGVTSLPASYAEFETAMKDKTGGAQKIYDGLKNEGVELPDFNEFYSVMMPEETKVQPAAKPQVKPATQSQQAVQPSTPKAGTPMTDSDKKGMMANAEVLKSNIETSVDNTAQRLNNLAKVNQPLKTDVKLGTQVSKVGDKYITTAGNDYDTPEQAKVEQFMIDESQSQRKREVDMVRARELEDDINKEKENLKKIKSTAIKTSGGFMPSDGGYLPYDPTAASESEKKIRELEQERRKVMMPMISGQLTDVNSRIETLNDEINNLKGGKAEKYSFGPSATTRVDDKVRLKNKELSLAMEERDALELMINGDDKNFFSGLIYGITRPSTYTFGLYDLAMSQDMLNAKNAYDKGALTDEQKQFMAAYEQASTAKAELDSNADSTFRFGNIAAQSAPFMLEFFGTGGMGGIQAAATSLAKRTAVALTKNMAKGMAKNFTRGFIKNTGIALGDIAAAGTMAVTTGGARTASDIINRYTGHPVQTDTGFTFKDGTTLADAVYKGLTSSTIEYYTEMLGTHMESVFPWIKSVIGKRMSQFAENVKGTKMGLAMAYGSIGLKKLGELADKSGIKAIYNDSKKAMKLFGLQSYPYEALEEEAGIVLNSMLTGDNKISDLVDGRTQEDIWGGMLYSIGMMQGITGGISAKKYYGLKHKLSNQDVVCSNLFGDQWASIKEQIDNATNANLLKTIFNVRTKSAEERKALLVYGGVLSQFRGFNSAVFGETEDKAANNTPSNPVSDAVNRGFTDGYNSTDEETARIENDLNDKKGLLNYDPGMSESEQFQSDVVRLQDNQEDALDYLIERYGEQHIGLATDYYNALNVYNGLTQRKADEDDDRLTHLNQQAERNEYKGQEGQSGNVITADVGGNKVYIVRGDVNTETGEMSGAIVVRDEQGKIIVTNGNALTLESVRPLEEIKQENAEIVAAERLAKEQEMKLAEEQQQEEQQIYQQQQPQDQPQDNQEQPQDNQEQQQDNQEQPQEPIEEMPMIGEGEEAEPDFYSVAPSRSSAFIYDESDLSEDEANEYVDANIEESNKKVKSLEKKKPKASTSINKYKKELDAWKQELEQAKKKADYWQQVKDEHLQKKEETPQNVEANTEDVNQAPAVENAPAEEQVNQQEETHTNEMIDDNENSNYQLSDEADDNGHQFVLNTDGNLEFGQISEETGLTPAPILLSEGIITNTKTNAGYGLVHIEARHGDQIRAAGYKSVLEFINDVAKNYESIRKGKKRDGRDTYLLQFTDKHNNTLMIELSRNGKYWNINTAGIFKTSYGANKTEVYNRHTTDNQPAGTDEVSLSGEQSGTTPSTRMNTPTQQPSDGSADKVTNTPDNNQGETEKKDESKSGVKESRVVGGNSGYVGYSMSKRAAQAREEGRFPKTDFKKVYGLSGRVFDMLVSAGIIDDSEWHHTSKFGNKTTFYSWAEDVYAEIYAANKKEFDAIAKKYNFKNQFESPDVGYGKLPREYRIEYRKLDDDRWKERNALREEYKDVEDGPRREEYLEKDRKIMEKYDSMEKELEKKYPEYAAYKENEKNWLNRADEISRDRKKMIEEVRSLMNEKEQDMYLRDAVIELLQQSGIEVVTNEEEAQRVLDEAHRMLDNGDIREHKLSLSYYPRLAISPVRGKWTKSKIIKRLKDIVGTKKGYSFAARRIAEFDSVEELAEHMFYHGSQFGSGRLKPSILMSDSEVERIGGGGYGKKYWGISVSRSKRIASNFSTGISVRVYPIILVKNAKIKEMPELSDAADLEDYIEDLWEEGVDAVWIGDKNRGEQELCVINPAAIVNIDNPDIYKYYKLGTSENPINIIDKDGINKLYQDAKRYVNALENKPKKPEKPSRFLPAKDGETIGEMKSDEQYQKEMSEYERKLDEYNNSDEVRRFQQEDEYAYRNIRFFKTPSGHAYGFTVDGKIYVDKKIAGSETPIHEYSHLWAAAMRQVNPEEWKNIVNLMKGTTLWEEVKKMYPELTTDDDIADEVLAHYSGKRGAERLKKAQEEAMKQEGLFDKAAALSAIYRVKEALNRFWKGVADFLGVHFTSAEEVADKVLSDLLNGVNPAGVAKNSEVRYQFIGEKGAAEIDAAEEATTRLDNLRVAREMEKDFNTRKKRINKLYNSEFVTVDFNNEFELNRDSAKEWIKKNLRREYKNGDTGDIIELSKIGINKVTSHGERDEAHLKSLVSIPKMIEKSVFIDELPNTKGNDKFDSYRYYACGLKIDGNDYTAKIVVGVKGNNKYYDHRLTEIEKGNLIDNLNGMAKSVAENQNASLSVGKDTKLLSILQINEQENAKKIKLATGWERGADGKWRYEILDGKFDRNGELHPERRRLSEEEHKFLEDNFEETMQAFKKGSLAYGKEITEDTDMADIYESGGMERKKAERIRSLEDKEERLIKEPKRLDDYLDSEELFTAYPELRDIEIDTSNPNAALYGHLASYDPTNKVIKLNDTSFDTLSHEVQHAIQYIEGFAKGGSSNNIRKRIKDIIDQNKDASEYAKSRLRQYAEAKVNQFFLEGSYDTLIKSDNPAIKRHAIEKYWEAMNFIDNEEASTLVNDYPNMSPDDIALSGYHVTEAAQELKRLAKSYKEDIPEANMDALNLVQKLEQSLQDKNDTQLYASIAGEVESRNVQKRLGMPMEIRRELLASETEDVAREDQIILEEGLGLNYSSTEGNPPKVKDGFTLYVAKDGSKIVSRSLFRDEDFKQIEAASEGASKGRAVRRKTVFSPARIRLRKLKEGETCSVERRYVENGMFDFTGKEKIESDADVAYIFRQLENAAVENCFMVLLKDGRPTVIHISMGSYSSTMAPFEQAFVAYSALKPDKVYFVHNHPSGNLKASRQDRDMLDRMKKMFGSDVVNPGIIIDTTSGKYGVFDDINIEEDMPVRQEGEVPLKVYNFSKQVFSPGWNPMESFKIKSPDDVAAFVSSHRLGEHEKMSFLVLGNDNSVVANVFLPYTKLSDIEEQGELKSATDMMAGYVHQCGGTRGIIYGNYDYTSTDGKLLSKISLRMKELGAPLLDAIHIEHSAMDEGVIGEPGVDGISLETVNKRFNNELERYQNREMASSEMLHLGNPRGVMRKFLPNIPIVMRQRILNKGAVKKHNVDVSSLSDMPQYLSSPIFVFQRNDNTLGVLTEMKDRDGKNICVAIEINRQIQDGGDILEVNDIRSVHGRNIADIIYPIINNETLKWVDKEKGLSYLSSASRYVQQEIDKKDLISATKVVKEFKNPIIEEDKNDLKDEILTRAGSETDTISGKESVKSPQKPIYTEAQKEGFAKQEKRRVSDAAREMAARLGIEDDVEFIETNEDLTGREATAKGWFNRKTGKIVVVLGNHISQTDVLRTIIHEGVAHYGLRKLLGERFDTFLDEVFKNAEQEVKESILELSKKHGYNVRTATEEYLASLAEKMDFEKAKNSGWWTKIKSMFLDMMRQLGLGTYVGPALTDNELRYLLWRSYENLAEPNRYNNPFAEAKDTSKQLELKVGGYENRSGRVNTTSDREGDLLFRDGDFTERDEAIARDAYERAMMSGRVQFIEEVQDSMRSLVELYKAILGKKTRVEDIEGFENPYMFENRLSSMNMAQQHLYFIDYMKPVLKAISRICKGNDKKREELINYMMAKHGLERNLVFAERDAKQKAMEEFAKELKAAEKSVFDDPLDANAVAALDDVKIRMQQREEELFFQNREKDYGGITGLMGIENLKDAEEAARTLVDDYEWEHDLYITDLWDAVNAATQATLDKVYESGIISKESYESIRDMFQYYIPLQGWDETTSDEIYAYLIDRKQMAGAPIKHAKGRRSKADDPIATIGMRGEMAVMQANRNLMKQTFLNFVLDHPSDLVSVSELWLEHDEVNDVWIPVFVDIEEGDTGEDIKRKTEAFEQQMEALQKQDPKKYKKSSQAQNIPYKVVPGNLKAHQVIVKRNGKSYVLTINGNPKAAMALNGLTNPDVEQKGFNKIMNAATYVNRKLSIAYTTANINFTVSNFVRDMVYSNTMSWIKESPWYAINFHWNCGKYNPAMLRRLFGKWENGTLDLNNKTEKLFYDFMKNGGETGFSNVRDIDAQKKFIISELKKENSLSRKAIALLTSQLDMLNRSVENTARFAAFVTSREVGRSIERSVYDAKEVSVNFNKKGSGGRFLGEKGQTALGNVGSVIGGSGRIGYVFWNAGIQGLSNIGKNMGRHKIKGIAGLAAMYVLGRVIPMLYGDDDDNSYYDIPEKVRRSNICIKVGEQWVTISLPIEFRAIYGLGELATGVESKNDVYTDKELAYQIGSQISQILPIDFLEGDGGVKNFVPTLLRPSFEAYINESWTGLPIYKDTPWNKNMPGWTKAYKNANVQLVDFAKFVSEITGGDEYKKGAIDINPAQVEHVLSGLFGGYVIMGNQLIKMAETATGERDFDWRNMIIANRVITNGDERVKEKRTTGMYYKIKEEVEEKRRLINSYRKDEMDEKADKLETPEYENALEDLKESQKNIKQIKEMIDETSDKDIQKELNKLIRQEEKTFVERHKKILK